MDTEKLLSILGADFYAGVPDSQLKALCDCLMNTYGIDARHHVIAANEGNCLAIAAGYHLSTGKLPVVYMQNSGQGNIVNPLASLTNDKVYAIPCLFVIGWRGEPGVHDEPQHVYQGEITLSLLELMDVKYFVIDGATTEEEVKRQLAAWQSLFAAGKQAAFVVKKGALQYGKKVEYRNNGTMTRERAIECILGFTEGDPVVSTTGKASRELFELREKRNEGHGRDFLTVGSMGHASSIAFGVAANLPQRTVWCIDGDGAALMHMGAMAVIGAHSPNNLKHIVINNGAHETVGGMPTVAEEVDLPAVAKNCNYGYVASVRTEEELCGALRAAKENGVLSLIEIRCSLGARGDLGRPTTTAVENKQAFMEYLKRFA